jgi:hypothetical protein
MNNIKKIQISSVTEESLIQLFEAYRHNPDNIVNNCKRLQIDFSKILNHFNKNRAELMHFFTFLFETKIINNIFKTDSIGLSTDYFIKSYNITFIQQVLLISLTRSNPKNFKYNAKILGLNKEDFKIIHYIYKNWQDLTNINLISSEKQFNLLKFFIDFEHLHVDQLFVNYSYEHYMFNSDFQLKWINSRITHIQKMTTTPSKKNVMHLLKVKNED